MMIPADHHAPHDGAFGCRVTSALFLASIFQISQQFLRNIHFVTPFDMLVMVDCRISFSSEPKRRQKVALPHGERNAAREKHKKCARRVKDIFVSVVYKCTGVLCVSGRASSVFKCDAIHHGELRLLP
jgi:hypothetical protein